jgi:MFS family permease
LTNDRATALLLNLGHAVDHMFLLIFATAVATIAAEFGFARWEDLMPYSVGAFFMFGIGAIPSGRLGDLWGRRRMMVIFFWGMGLSAILVALTQSAWQIAIALALLGMFASIYHPVGIPMLMQKAKNYGITIGINGLVGNLGIALAAIVTGLLVKYFGWRAAFIVPGAVSIACGIAFQRLVPAETEAPARRTTRAPVALPESMMPRLFATLTFAAASSSLLFNFTTNGNGQLLRERFAAILDDPAALGLLLGLVYAIASLAQLVVGNLIDRYPLRRLYLAVVLAQIPVFLLAAYAEGWVLLALLVAFMILIFGGIPFNEAMIARYVDDRLRSRVSGMRAAVAFGISSLAVWSLGPAVKAAGFQTLLIAMAGIAACTAFFVTLLPKESSALAASKAG